MVLLAIGGAELPSPCLRHCWDKQASGCSGSTYITSYKNHYSIVNNNLVIRWPNVKIKQSTVKINKRNKFKNWKRHKSDTRALSVCQKVKFSYYKYGFIFSFQILHFALHTSPVPLSFAPEDNEIWNSCGVAKACPPCVSLLFLNRLRSFESGTVEYIYIYIYSQVKNNIHASLYNIVFSPENRKIFVCNKRKIQLFQLFQMFQVFQLFHSVFRVLDDAYFKRYMLNKVLGFSLVGCQILFVL